MYIICYCRWLGFDNIRLNNQALTEAIKPPKEDFYFTLSYTEEHFESTFTTVEQSVTLGLCSDLCFKRGFGCDVFSYNVKTGLCVFAPNSPLKGKVNLNSVTLPDENWTTFVLECSEGTENALGNDFMIRDVETNCGNLSLEYNSELTALCNEGEHVNVSGIISASGEGKYGLFNFRVEASSSSVR